MIVRFIRTTALRLGRGPGGTPIEPPCCSWDGDEEIYEGMYAEIDYSPQKLKWMQEDFERREAEKKKADKRAEVERLKERVWKLTGGHTGTLK